MSNLGPQFSGITINHPVAGPVRISKEEGGEFGIAPKGGHVLRASYHPDFSMSGQKRPSLTRRRRTRRISVQS